MNYVEPIRNLEDLNKILAYFKESNFMYYTIFIMGIHTGLRVSDILGLNIPDVEGKDTVTVREKKTGKLKKFPLKEIVKSTLNEYLETFRSERYSLIKGCEPLFVGKKHKRVERSVVYKKINEACKKCRIDINVGTHTMRKTFGYHHYKQFRDVALLQTIFNHSAPSITLRYIGITQEEINKSYDEFSYDNNIEQYQTALITEKAETTKVRNKNTILNNTIKEFKNIIQEIRKDTYFIKKEIKNLKETNCNKEITRNTEAEKVLKNLKNYLANGGGKYSAFCELMLTVD